MNYFFLDVEGVIHFWNKIKKLVQTEVSRILFGSGADGENGQPGTPGTPGAGGTPGQDGFGKDDQFNNLFDWVQDLDDRITYIEEHCECANGGLHGSGNGGGNQGGSGDGNNGDDNGGGSGDGNDDTLGGATGSGKNAVSVSFNELTDPNYQMTVTDKLTSEDTPGVNTEFTVLNGNIYNMTITDIETPGVGFKFEEGKCTLKNLTK